MGFAHRDHGVYLFNDMDSEEAVKELVEFSSESLRTGGTNLPEALRTRLEKQFDARVIDQIPWQ